MKFKSIVVFVLFVLSLGVLGKYLYQSSVFNISEIKWEYQGSEHANYFKSLESELSSKINFVIGSSIWKIKIHDLEKQINSFNWVESARIQRKFPDKLSIEVKYKKILATVLTGSGLSVPVAEDASLLKAVKITQSPQVPVLTNSDFKTVDSLRMKVVGVLKKMPKEGFLSHDSITDIKLDKEGEFSFRIKNSDSLVKLSSENTELKISRVNKVINYLDQNQIKGRVIDANFSKKVVVKLRNQD